MFLSLGHMFKKSKKKAQRAKNGCFGPLLILLIASLYAGGIFFLPGWKSPRSSSLKDGC